MEKKQLEVSSEMVTVSTFKQ